MEKKKSLAFVQGEDSESDEEINTEHMTSSMETTFRQLTSSSTGGRPVPGVVAGEGSETDEEDDSRASASGSISEQTDGSGATTLRVPAISGPQKAGSERSTPRSSSRRSSGDSSTTFPLPSLLHKKLRDRNTSLRKNIVERVLRIYHATCRNLTIVNDNLSRNQATIEKVNSHLKRAGQDLEKINITMEMTSEAVCTFAPTLRMDVPLRGRPPATNDPSNSSPPAGPLTKTPILLSKTT